jgi:hypothetical protein
MSSKQMGFNATVISGVLSTLLAAVATWLFGFWPQLWSGIVNVAGKLWEAVAYPVSVPLGVLVPVGILAVLPTLRLLKKKDPTQIAVEPRYQSKATPTGEWKKNQATEPDPLSSNEVRMLQVLAHADGEELMLSDIAGRSGFSNLVAEQTAEHLLRRRYLTHRRDILTGSMLRLSSAGRDFVLSAGY